MASFRELLGFPELKSRIRRPSQCSFVPVVERVVKRTDTTQV
jgi:hypothetical protein